MKHIFDTFLALQPKYRGVWANDCGVELGGVVE
jgi:hypothetical protein